MDSLRPGDHPFLNMVERETVQVVAEPQHTRNLFGPLGEIAGARLTLMERNSDGDCLCLFQGQRGTNLVDVDRRDILPALEAK